MTSFLTSRYARQITEMIILVLMLAPVPAGHCHSDCGSGISIQQMTLHLQIYHGGLDNEKNWPKGWHLHWGFPQHGENVTVCDVTTTGDRMLSSCAKDLFEGIDLSQLNSCKLWPLVYHQPLSKARQHSFLTVAFLHSEQSLPELLGIMRC